MTAIEASNGRPFTRGIEGGVEVGPTDAEIVGLLRRIASARAHLAQAEQRAAEAQRRSVRPEILERNRAIEHAHAERLWAQADLLCGRRGRAERAVRVAEARERAVLTRYGFSSFAEYLAERNATPTSDLHLELARREYEDAQAAWERLQEAMAPTLIIDLTGDEPRVI
jgi:hypothetical protein